MKRPTPPAVHVRDLIALCLELHEEHGPRAVEELLGRHPESSTLVRERLDLLASMGLVGEAPAEGLPDRIGEYRVVGVLGRGGMGVVYEAEQERPHRRVALKVLRNWQGARGQARFELESELLARLHHPGIAAIHGAGTATVGGMTVPFFAMELVRGRPLDIFADEEGQDMRGRVTLLVRVAEAVHHAHQKGVVHRDLKPSNVLVDERGAPRVLDFGVARVIDPDLTLETLRTQTGQLVGTVPYMSPEQALGQSHEVDVQSDVYSLGVLAFELLAGRLPIEVAELSVLEAARRIHEADPLRLGQVDPEYRGDLETVVGTALAKEKERRYPSAHAFAADLQRFLDNEPISARPATASYQLAKFARRHRTLVVGASAVFVSLVLGLFGTLYGLARAETQRDDAERRYRQANTLLEFQERMYQFADPSGEGIQVRDLLDQSLLLVDGFGADAAEAAAIRMTLGKAYRGIGDFEKAEPLVASSVRTFSEELGDEDPQSISARTQWAALLGRSMGRFQEADEVLDGVVETARRTLGPRHEATLSARLVEVGVHYDLGRMREGCELATEIEELADPGSAAWYGARRWRSSLMNELGETELAIEIARADLDRLVETLGREHPSTWRAMEALGTMLQYEGRSLEGAPLLEELMELHVRFLGEQHPTTLHNKIKVAVGYEHQGEHERAEALLDRTIAVSEAAFGPDYPTRLAALNVLSIVYSSQGRSVEAEATAREVTERTLEVRGPEHTNTLRAMANHAVILQQVGRSAEAEDLYLDVLDLTRATLGDEHQDTLVAAFNLGAYYAAQQRNEEAEVLLREALEVARGILPEDHSDHAIFLRRLGECLLNQRKFEEAEERLLASRVASSRTHAPGHEEHGRVLESLASLYRAWNRKEEAARYRGLLEQRGVDEGASPSGG